MRIPNCPAHINKPSAFRSAKKAGSLLVANGDDDGSGSPANLVAATYSGSDDSDDSIVGEHSPFIKHATRKRYVSELVAS